MRKKLTLFTVISVGLVFMLNVSVLMGATKNKILIAEQEEHEAQKTAQQFVREFQKTRDVSALTKKMFLSDFISHFVSEGETVAPPLYRSLTKEERLRLFIVQINMSYLQAIDVKWHPERRYISDENEKKLALQSILPNTLAEKVKSNVFKGGELSFTNYKDFKMRLPVMEKVLAEVRLYLIKKNIEQTQEFQKRLDDTITNEGINYRVRTYIGGNEIKDCETLVGFPKNQKFYRVETPLFLGVILIKIGNQMKIVRITGVDTD